MSYLKIDQLDKIIIRGKFGGGVRVFTNIDSPLDGYDILAAIDEAYRMLDGRRRKEIAEDAGRFADDKRRILKAAISRLLAMEERWRFDEECYGASLTRRDWLTELLLLEDTEYPVGAEGETHRCARTGEDCDACYAAERAGSVCVALLALADAPGDGLHRGADAECCRICRQGKVLGAIVYDGEISKRDKAGIKNAVDAVMEYGGLRSGEWSRSLYWLQRYVIWQINAADKFALEGPWGGLGCEDMSAWIRRAIGVGLKDYGDAALSEWFRQLLEPRAVALDERIRLRKWDLSRAG